MSTTTHTTILHGWMARFTNTNRRGTLGSSLVLLGNNHRETVLIFTRERSFPDCKFVCLRPSQIICNWASSTFWRLRRKFRNNIFRTLSTMPFRQMCMRLFSTIDLIVLARATSLSTSTLWFLTTQSCLHTWIETMITDPVTITRLCTRTCQMFTASYFV